MDCRNLLALPRRRTRELEGSPTLDLAVASGSIVRVGSASNPYFKLNFKPQSFRPRAVARL